MKPKNTQNTSSVKLFLCGDVMIGRGIDQILPYSVHPKLFESYVKDARDYVDLAIRKNGNIQQPVSFNYIWGDALKIWEKMSPLVKIINLETSITTHNQPWTGKGINYRMHPKNIEVLTVAGINFCSLANNHTLDWERAGLIETIKTLQAADISFSGAGINSKETVAPGIFPLNNGNIIVLAYGARSSGIPASWASQENLSGINMLSEDIETSVNLIKNEIKKLKQKNDIVVFSVHWGSNWGYNIPSNHQKLAHEIIDNAGVDIVHGHSSHHPLGMEVYRNKLIIYGAGDFINDYEGIGGHEDFRGDLSLMYFPEINLENGQLISVKMAPLTIKNFKLNNAYKTDALWLKDILNKEGKKLGTQVKWNEDNMLELVWE